MDPVFNKSFIYSLYISKYDMEILVTPSIYSVSLNKSSNVKGKTPGLKSSPNIV